MNIVLSSYFVVYIVFTRQFRIKWLLQTFFSYRYLKISSSSLIYHSQSHLTFPKFYNTAFIGTEFHFTRLFPYNNVSISSWNSSLESPFWTCLTIVASTANMLPWYQMDYSPRYKNITWDRTQPWGMPLVTLQSEYFPLNTVVFC